MGMDPELEEEIRRQTIGQSMTEDDIEPTDFAKIMGQIHYLFTDPKIIAIMLADKKLRPFLPIASPVNRTSRLDDKIEIRGQKLKLRIALRWELMVMSKVSRLSEFYTWQNFLEGCIEDKRNGWRGKLTTEKTKITKFEGAPKPRKKWFGLF